MEFLRKKHNLEQYDVYKSSLMEQSEINTLKERCNNIQSENWKVCKVEVGNVVFYDVVTNVDYARPFTKQECEFIVNAQEVISKLIQHINGLQSLLDPFQQAQENQNDRKLLLKTLKEH
ncbi:hypothetical protein ACE198_01340 [Neobacillus sp. KR4-4]|uniref:hypothetical protein n=1 Tax=Neobacillus sp. KR4-4 TaxID=3344872 RepID=UPI0035C9F371